MRKITLPVLFFLLTPLVLILNIEFLSFIRQQKTALIPLGQTPKVAYAAIPASNRSFVLKTESKDAREESVRTFFARYRSALTPYAKNVIAAADKYGLDYRLIPAIAMQESTLCNNLPSKLKNTYNCWGFGIYGKKVTKFDNYPQAIDIVSKTLAREYKAAGLNSPMEIMSKYTPSNTGIWAQNVSFLMDRLSI